MRDFLQQVHRALDENLYYVALFAALTIPDICGAMESGDGKAHKCRYIAWFDKWVTPKKYSRSTLTGEVCYYYRCAVLHQGRATHPKMPYERVLFVEPGATNNVFHNNVINDALNIDVRVFVRDILEGASKWLQEVENTDNYQRNYARFMRRFPNGLSPYISGVPVITSGNS